MSDLLVTETSPYGSRSAVVEDDGRTVYLYLTAANPQNPEKDMSAVWVANLIAGPDERDLPSMEAGTPPLMPRGGTCHPEGRPSYREEDLELVWFEEGDGVALLERGQPLAVIPGWSGFEGFHGYARDAVGQQELAWELAQALEGLGPRIESARRYWEWRARDDSWPSIQDDGIRHLERRLGPQRRYWSADGGEFPPRAVALFQPEAYPGISVCATIGMSAQAMPGVEMYVRQHERFRRIELALGTAGDPARAASLLSGMVGFPWSNVTWLGDGHTYGWEPPSDVPGRSSVLLLRDPPAEGKKGLFRRGQPPPDLSGLRDRGGDPVTYLWVVPITHGERELAQRDGSTAVVREMQRQGRGWVWRLGET